jgi:hypothetical protein
MILSSQQRSRCNPRSPTINGVRSVRPSLLDLRFTGDPWVVDEQDGTSSLRLDDYCLASIAAVGFDLPVFNRTLLALRLRQARRHPTFRMIRCPMI